MSLFLAWGVLATTGLVTATTRLYEQYKDENKICSPKELKTLRGSINLTSGFSISQKEAEKSVLFVGPSAIGKTTRFYKHIIKSLSKASAVITDPSGKLSESIEKKGYTTYKIKLLDPKNSIGWNIFELCDSTYELRNIMRLLIRTGHSAFETKGDHGNQKEWLLIAESLLMSYAIMNYKRYKGEVVKVEGMEPAKPYNLAEFVQNLLTKPIFALPDNVNPKPIPIPLREGETEADRKYLQQQFEVNENSIEFEIVNSLDKEAITEFQQFKNARNQQGGIISSIRTVLTASLKLFSIPSVQEFCTLPSIDFKKLRDEKTLLFIEVPEQYTEDMKPLTSVITQQIINTLFRYKTEEGLPVFLLFDEFGNIGEIPNLSHTITQCRKYHIPIIASLQSILQIYNVYGEVEGDLILEAFQTKIVSGGLEYSAEYFSKKLGVVEEIDKQGNKSYTPLMTADQLRRIPKDVVLILSSNKRPVKDNLLPIIPNNVTLKC